MTITRHTDVAAFWALAGPLYRADPLRHTVALTVLTTLDPNAELPLLLTLEGDSAVGAAFCTPGRPLGVSAVPVELLPELVEFLRASDFAIAGVSSPRDVADRFADLWVDATGATKHLVFALRLYRLGDLVPPVVEGAARIADESDIELLALWRKAFTDEAGHGKRHSGLVEDHHDIVRRSLAGGDKHVLWERDGVPVATANATTPSGGMSRVRAVYTPPEHRAHGYGSAVTAAASRCALDAGAEHVTLFTDLANPVSNSIYQKIGYVPHHDAVEYRFDNRLLSEA